VDCNLAPSTVQAAADPVDAVGVEYESEGLKIGRWQWTNGGPGGVAMGAIPVVIWSHCPLYDLLLT
jgi:hypothetical protein